MCLVCKNFPSFHRDLNLDGANRLDNRPSLAEVAKAFRSPRIISYVGALSLTFLLVLLWPAVATVAGVMNLGAFSAWVRGGEDRGGVGNGWRRGRRSAHVPLAGTRVRGAGEDGWNDFFLLFYKLTCINRTVYAWPDFGNMLLIQF